MVDETFSPPTSRLRAALGLTGARAGDVAMLVAVLAIAATMRFWWVMQPLIDTFSWREASTAMIAENFRDGGWNIFFPEVNWTGPGPGYQGREFQLMTYIVALLQALFGAHDYIGRAVASVFGLVTVFSLHRLAALVWDEAHAHAAALAYALTPGAIMIDSSFLPDPVMLALVTLGVWLFVRYWQVGERPMLIAASVAFGLGTLTKLPGLGVGLVVMWLTAVLAARGEWRRVRETLLAMAAILLVLGAYYSWAIYLGGLYPPFHVAGSGYIWDLGLSYFLSRYFFLSSLWDTAVWWFYGYPLIGAIVVGLWMLPRKRADDSDGLLVHLPLVWLLAACAVYVAAAREVTNNPWNQHIFNIPLAFLAGRALVALVRLGGVAINSWQGRLRVALAVAVVLAFSTGPLLLSMKKPIAENAMKLGLAMAILKAPGDLVVAISPDVGDPTAIYHSGGRGWVFPPGGGSNSWSVFFEDNATAIARLEELRAEGAAWFGYTKNAKDDYGRLFVDHHAGFIEWLGANATLAEDTPYYAIYRLHDGGQG